MSGCSTVYECIDFIEAAVKAGSGGLGDSYIRAAMAIIGEWGDGGASWGGGGGGSSWQEDTAPYDWRSAVISAEQLAAIRYADMLENLARQEFVPPIPLWSRGPKTSTTVIGYYQTLVDSTSAAPGVAFARYGYEPKVGCKVYWDFVASATNATLGGFGVGCVVTATDSEPGKTAENPAAMLYREGGGWSVWVDGVETVQTSVAEPTRIGVAVEVVGLSELALTWYLNGVKLNAAPIAWTFSGPLWLPVLCTLTDAVTFTMEAAA